MESGKLISATDTQYSGTLLTSLDEQRTHGLFCDVTVVVEGKKFRAHRNILSASSTFFSKLFSIAGQVVELNFVKAVIFAEILNYVYSSKIVTLRTELLEEFVKSGKILGIKFIADLGIALSQMENIASGAKDDNKYSCDFDENIIKFENALSKQLDKYVHNSHSLGHMNDQDRVEHCDDDGVTVFRDLVSPSHVVSNQAELVSQNTGVDVLELSNQQMSDNSKISNQNEFILDAKYSRNMLHSVIPHQTHYFNACSPGYAQASCPPFGTSPNHLISDTLLQNQHPLNYSGIPVQQLLTKDYLSSIPVISSIESCASQGALTSSSNNLANLEKGSLRIIQNPQISEFTQSSTNPGKQNITFSGSNPVTNEDFYAVMGDGCKYDIDSKRIFSLDNQSEIDELSTVSKFVKNPVEDAHDIVITLKDETDTDGEEDLPKSIDGSLNSGRLKHQDHYQVLDDGKVYYICNVCKRSYVSLRNLRRHFNIHSLEHEYPCRYCGEVFLLGEYRTRHETRHTGVKRYQCLTCREAFIHYKSMSTHMKSVHNQDPSLDTKLYRMHSSHSATIQDKTYINSSRPSSDGMVVYDGKNEQPTSEEVESCSPSKQMKCDVLFSQHGRLHIKDSPSKASAEIEFVIPEFY